jgi:chitinase
MLSNVTSVSANHLPVKVSGGYWQNWGKPDISLRNVPAGFNVVLIGFAYGDGGLGGGLVLDLPSFQNPASLKSDIDTLHGQGRKVLLSIGGSNDLGVHVRTAAQVVQMVTSLDILMLRYGFDGIDWDLEYPGNFTIDGLLSVSRQLKSKWGSIITINAAPSVTAYKQLAQRLGSNLDMICQQFYGYDAAEPSEWLSGVTYRVNELISTYGIPASKVAIGVKNIYTAGSTLDTSQTTTIGTTNMAWSLLTTKYPAIRGILLWSVNLDQSVGFMFLNQVTPRILETR